MADLFDNPMGLDGFEFVEFAAAKKGRSLPQANANAKPVRILRQIAESVTGSVQTDEKKSRWGKLSALGKK